MTIADAVQATEPRRQAADRRRRGRGAASRVLPDFGPSVGYTQGLTQRLNLTMGYGYRRSDSKSGAATSSRSRRRAVSVTAWARACRSRPAIRYSVDRVSARQRHRRPLSKATASTAASTTTRRCRSPGARRSDSRRALSAVSDGRADALQRHRQRPADARDWAHRGRPASVTTRNVSYVETFRAPVLSDDSLTAASAV